MKTDNEKERSDRKKERKIRDIIHGEGAAIVSLWALCARGSFYKILLVLAGMALAEFACFEIVCRKMTGNAALLSPEKMIDECLLQPIFLCAFGLVYFILLWTESEHRGTRSGYTLLRLRVTQRQQFAVRTVYNMFCLTLVFSVQAALAAALCARYAELLPEELVSPQLLFLAFYRNRFLHSLLPMAEIGKWVKNLLLLTAFGMEAALGLQGRNYLTSIWLCILSARLFAADIGSLNVVLCSLLYLFCIAASLLQVYGVIGKKETADS